MWIYKISNTENDKVYIGQSKRPVDKRFNRHINDAVNLKLDTHFARAIRKYGADKFNIEIIDSAETQKELNEKERYWIHFYDSIKNGYNETDAEYKCGGNTYLSKTPEEMEKIKTKIRKTKLGKNNPMSKPIYLIDMTNNTKIRFETIISCAKYLGIKGGKTSLTNRLSGKVKSLYKNKYWFEYCDE